MDAMANSIYLIQKDSAMFATFVDKPLVIACPDKYKLRVFKRILDRHKYLNNLWLSKCTHQYREKDRDVLQLSSNHEDSQYSPIASSTYISRIDLYEPDSLKILNDLYQFCESEVFVMYDFQHTREEGADQVLTLKGVRVSSENLYDDVETDYRSYLEGLIYI